MKTLRCWNDLIPFGIDPLTGEACGLTYRILCDVTDQGRRVVQKCFGFPDLSLSAAWNRGTEQEPHTGSLMLAPEMLVPLGIFALLEAGCTEVWLSKDGTVAGVEPTDSPERVAAWKQAHAGEFARRFAYQGTARDRNVHVMTGRVE